MPRIHQRHRRTDRRMTYDSNTALALRASRSNNINQLDTITKKEQGTDDKKNDGCNGTKMAGEQRALERSWGEPAQLPCNDLCEYRRRDYWSRAGKWAVSVFIVYNTHRVPQEVLFSERYDNRQIVDCTSWFMRLKLFNIGLLSVTWRKHLQLYLRLVWFCAWWQVSQNLIYLLYRKKSIIFIVSFWYACHTNNMWHWTALTCHRVFSFSVCHSVGLSTL